MKHVNKIIIAFLLTAFAGSNYVDAQTNSFYVYFKQNDKKKNITESKVVLLKEPFKIFVEYTEIFDLTLHSSLNKKVYNDAVKGELLFNLIDKEAIKSRPSIFEKKNVLQTHDKQSLLWEKEKSDCDSINKIGKRYVSVKNVEKVFIPEKLNDEKDKKEQESGTYEIKDLGKDLYLVFIYAEKDATGDFQEIQREIVSIEWGDIYEEDTKKFKKEKKKKEKEKERAKKRKENYKERLEKKEEKRLLKLEEIKKKKEEKNNEEEVKEDKEKKETE